MSSPSVLTLHLAVNSHCLSELVNTAQENQLFGWPQQAGGILMTLLFGHRTGVSYDISVPVHEIRLIPVT